jgi:hypothetical protein
MIEEIQKRSRACLMKLATPLCIYVSALICTIPGALPSLIFTDQVDSTGSREILETIFIFVDSEPAV